MTQPETEKLAGQNISCKAGRRRRITARIIVVLAYVVSCLPLISFGSDLEALHFFLPLAIAPTLGYEWLSGGNYAGAIQIASGVTVLAAVLYTLFRPNLIAAISLAAYFFTGGVALFVFCISCLMANGL